MAGRWRAGGGEATAQWAGGAAENSDSTWRRSGPPLDEPQMETAAPPPPSPPPAWIPAEFSPGVVSVVIPTYNRARLIFEALAALRAQTWRALEVIVVDDGSTDDTCARLLAGDHVGAGRTFHLLRREHRGVSAARNAGTRHSTGEFIYYLDSDDLIEPEALTRFVTAIREHGAAYAYAAIAMADAAGRPEADNRRGYPAVFDRERFFDCQWLVHGACYRRAVVAGAGPWNEALRCGEDSEFLWRVNTLGAPACRVAGVQGVYRQHDAGQLSARPTQADKFEDLMGALDMFVAWLGQTGRMDRALRRALIRYYGLIGVQLGIAGRVAAKDRAFDGIRRLTAGRWDVRRICTAGRWIDAPAAFVALRRLRHAPRVLRSWLAKKTG